VARFSGARWRPLAVNWNGGRPSAVNIVVIHQFAGGNPDGVFNFLSNPARQASYHFGVGRNGAIQQWVDTANTAWHAGNVNGRSIGIGHEALNTPMTEAQLNATASIIRWARGAHRGIPAGQNGIGWHRQFMATACPGDPIIRQIGELQRRSTASAPAPQPPPASAVSEDSMQILFGANGAAGVAVPGGRRQARFVCPQGHRIRVEFMGVSNATATLNLGRAPYDRTVNIPANCRALRVISDSGARSGTGDNPVDLAWL
jgi:hypothetical protein